MATCNETSSRLDEMDLLYSPSRWCRRLAPDFVITQHVSTIAAASEKARRSLRCQLNVAYGPTSRQKYDILSDSSTPPDAPILVYIHGGYWQILSKDESSFAAEPVVKSAHAVFAAVDYELCPNVSMTEIVEQVHAAVDQITQWALKRGSRGIFLAGHSAGAHLAAIVLDRIQTNQSEDTTGTDLIKGLVLISGIYDLRPMLDTSENTALRMTEEEAWSLSPMNAISLTRLQQQHNHVDILIAVAENDSPAFRQQSQNYELALLEKRIAVRLLDVKDADHFDIVERLTDNDYLLTKAIISMLQEHQRSSTIAEIVSHYTD
jgi:arylformamidase